MSGDAAREVRIGDLMTLRMVQARSGLAASTVEYAVATGNLATFRVGHIDLTTREDYDRWQEWRAAGGARKAGARPAALAS